MLARGAHDLGRDVAVVEALVGGVDGLRAALACGECSGLGLEQLVQRGLELGLAENLAGRRGGAPRRVVGVIVRQEHAARIGPSPGIQQLRK